MEELERHVAFEIAVPGAEDLSHAAGAKRAEDMVATHDVAGYRKGVRLFGRWLGALSILPTLR
jgi:hypothetical protein